MPQSKQKNVTPNVGLSMSSSSSLKMLLETLEEITNLPLLMMNEMEVKQNALKSCIKCIRDEMEGIVDVKQDKSATIIVPLSSISNAKAIMKHVKQQNNNNDKTKISFLEQKLEQTLCHNTKLTFPSSSSSSSTSTSSSSSTSSSTTYKTKEEKEAYQKRIELLKLNIEERKYTKLTSNLDVTPKDDETLSSMLYASSVGMNMIVAPISIGVLMYFFAGKLLLWIFGTTTTTSTSTTDSESYIRTSRQYTENDGQLNIHGVIVGVVSGVIMLFIEMILFVIRNHEMDKHLTEKKKKRKKNPFGYDVKSAKRTFHG